VAIINI